MPAPTAPASPLLLFVYGSLKRGESNQRHLGSGAAFVGEARTAPGYRLFNLGTYPGMVDWPDDPDGVSGEIWSVPAANLAHLDAFEGVPTQLYRRAPIRLQPPFAAEPVETYFYARSVAGRPAIPGGAWHG